MKTNVFENLGLSSEVTEANFKYAENFHPIGRIGCPSDIASMAGFLASDKAAFITGSIIEVDGGYSIQGQHIIPDNT